MALEMNVESQMQAAKCQGSSLESLSSKASMEALSLGTLYHGRELDQRK